MFFRTSFGDITGIAEANHDVLLRENDDFACNKKIDATFYLFFRDFCVKIKKLYG